MHLKKYGGIVMNQDKEQLDELFSEQKIHKIIIKSKYRQLLKMIMTALLVIVFVWQGNTLLGEHLSNKLYKKLEAAVIVQVPNGYLSYIDTTIGLGGAKINYTISKNLLYKKADIEKGIIKAGYYQNDLEWHTWTMQEEWPIERWQEGVRKLMFFHPGLEYKTYKNDLNLLEQISDAQIMELGLSFDRAYTLSEVQEWLKDYKVQWLWLDAYSKTSLEEMKKEIHEKGPNMSFILEDKLIGVNLWNNNINSDLSEYDKLMDCLKNNKEPKYQQAYETLQDKHYTTLENAKFLGAIIIADKEELEALGQDNRIKAISLGVTANKY